MQNQEQKDNDNDTNVTSVLFLLHAKCNSEITLDWNINFYYELIVINL